MVEPSFRAEPSISLVTDHAVAVRSNDHLFPRATRVDNTHHPRFAAACERHFGRRLRFADLGCAGGGLVFDFLTRGHQAVGLEGSDYSLVHRRAEWATIPGFLFTCDIAKPFSLIDRNSMELAKFDVMTAWDVLEHLSEDDLRGLFANIRRHLRAEGLFVGSIATFHDVVDGVSYHLTVEGAAWWRGFFVDNGFAIEPRAIFAFEDFCRGTGIGPGDTDFSKSPHLGFHFVARAA
jgi:SAM-dependent methyltransferase